ncbi:MAG: hypothetical protein C0591_04940 [Marinilabiliales bacterium]|nr:MAG: hypothetical protein C0591_04940 [Marinilabiliales bacterium]
MNVFLIRVVKIRSYKARLWSFCYIFKQFEVENLLWISHRISLFSTNFFLQSVRFIPLFATISNYE